MLFSKALMHARATAKLSRYDLAEQTGISYKHISNLEAGKRPPSLSVVRALHGRLHFPQRVLLALFAECHGDS